MLKRDRDVLPSQAQTVIQASQLLLLRRNQLKRAEDLHVGQSGGIFDFGEKGKAAYDAAVHEERTAALDLHDALLRFFGCSHLPNKQLRVVPLPAILEKNEVIL